MKPRKLTFRSLLFPCGAVLLSVIASTAIAQPMFGPCGVDRGSAIFYNSNQNVCWMADANLAGDPVMRATSGVTGINPNGTMDFDTAKNWVTALNAYNNGQGYLFHNNWQLPFAPLYDTTCAEIGKGGGNFGPGCTGSAMGNLYNLGLNRSFPHSAAPGYGATVTPFWNLKLSYYWTSGTIDDSNDDTKGGQEVFAFSNGMGGGVTTKYPYYYVLPMVAGALGATPGNPKGTPPACPPGSGVVPYTSGPGAWQAVYDCLTGYTWPIDANLAAQNPLDISGTTPIALGNNHNATIWVPKIDEGGAMLYATATQWIQMLGASNYLGSKDWVLPKTSSDLKNLFIDLNLVSSGPSLMLPGNDGAFQNLQPFYYWGCGNSGPLCTVFAPPNGVDRMQWTFNFDDGFQGTAATVQHFFVMVYYPAPSPPHCSTPMQCCIQAGGYWANGHCE